MKKIMVLCACFCVAMAFTGCKSKESAYKKAYEKAKAQETVEQQPTIEEQPVTQQPVVVEQPKQVVTVTPMEEKPVNNTTVVNVDNVQVRQEKVAVVNGSGLKNFSVVVGSFSVKANAEGLQQRLRDAGYDAQVAKNVDRDMFRVIAYTFDDKLSAVNSRDQLRTQFPDAWLLYNVQ
ncbi:MAG: SPOR domain-containing protein [Prevotella sp.]|nr:SPOR domain-containing protein [Prevotella sp.]